MKRYEFTAKSVDKAIEEGLLVLGLKQEDVSIKILSEGGFLKKAKVVIEVEEPEYITDFAKKEEPVQEAKVTEKEEPKPEVKEETKPVEVESNEEKRVSLKEEPVASFKKQDNRTEPNTTSVEFVKGLLLSANIEGTVKLEEKINGSYIYIETEDSSKLIGYHGDGLNALQVLANTVEQRVNPKAKRVIIDVSGYKERREESLRALAIRIAGKVEETGRPYKLEPMNSYERRIIHTELQNYASVETHSEGVEPHRRLVVTKK